MKRKGFSLIEIMVVVAIVGILAAIAIPSYSNYIKRTRRAEAVTALQTVALYQEKAMAESGSYKTEADLVTNYGLKPSTGNNYNPTQYYNIDIYVPDATHFSAYASGTGTNADTKYILAINQDGTVGTAAAINGAITANAELWKSLR